MSVDEYRRLKAIEQQQRQKDFDILLAPPGADALAEDAAHDLAFKSFANSGLERSEFIDPGCYRYERLCLAVAIAARLRCLVDGFVERGPL